jgi:hypothetical protein
VKELIKKERFDFYNEFMDFNIMIENMFHEEKGEVFNSVG